MERTTPIIYSRALWLLLVLFCFRVFAQLAVYFIELPFLPGFAQWHSASIPYPVLVFSQLLIILIYSLVALQFSRGHVVARYRVGLILLFAGGVYFSIMLIRLVIGLAELSELHWWNQPIPSVFHLVLSSFLIVVGLFHWRYGKTQQ